MSEISQQQLNQQNKLSNGKSTIGIDISTSSVNIAQIVSYRGKPTLIKTALVEINKESAMDMEQATLKALNEALANFNFKKAKFACVVNCPQTCVRKVITPYMPKDELKGAVSLEAKRSIPFQLSEAVLDYNVIEEIVDKGIEKLSVIVAASPRETIDKLLSYFSYKQSKPFSGGISKKFKDEELLKPIGLKISGILPLALCLENVIEQSKLKMDETMVTIEMGTVTTELNIFKNSRLHFSRKIPFSGDDITKSLMGALMTEQGKVELTMEEAEAIKREHGIPNIEDNELIKGKLTTNQVLSLIRPVVEQLASEIERSFDFFREEMQGSKVDRVILFGGGAYLKGLPKFLNKELGIEVSIGNPLEDINMLFDGVVEKEEDAQRIVLAIGAALSSMRGINLLPIETKEKTKRIVEMVSVPFITILIFAMIFGVYININLKTKVIRNELQKTVAEYAVLEPQLQEIKEKQLVDSFSSNRPHWDEVLKEISNVVAENMQLTSVKMDEDKIIFKGEIAPGEQATETTLSQFMLSIERGIFKNVKLISTKKNLDEEGTSEFEVTCKVE